MTRKRKNVEPEEPPPVQKKSFPPKRDNRSGGYNNKKEFTEHDFAQQYGYVAVRENNQPVKSVPEKPFSGRDFPEKSFSEKTFPEKKFPGKNFSERKGQDESSEPMEWASSEPATKESPFPTELVTYLRNMATLIQSEGELENEILDKCLEECAGEEGTLLSFRDACVAVENVFGSKPYGAAIFLKAVSRMKHKLLVNFMFGGCSARTMERLLLATCPIDSNETIEVLTKFVELLCDNWNDAITLQPSTYLLRSIGRVACGLPPRDKKANQFAIKVVKPKFSSPAMEVELQRIFSLIMDRATDVKASGSFFNNSFCSMLLQELFEDDAAVSGGRSDAFIRAALDSMGENEILASIQGKESSRIWDVAFTYASDDTRKLYWDAVIAKHFKQLVYHSSANFPLQKLINSTKSLELATSICSLVTPLISTLLAEQKAGVVTSLVRCSTNHPDLQENILKELRKHFNAETSTNKNNFLFNVLTSNRFDGSKINLNDCQYHGSLLLQELFKLTKVKTLSACIEAIPPKTIYEMGIHKIASHVIQATLSAPTVADDIKLKICNSFENSWVPLITNPIGSHVFDAIWDCPVFKVAKKQDLMKSFVPVRADSKFWKFAMLRCDMQLFRKNRKAWVDKQKNWTAPKKSS